MENQEFLFNTNAIEKKISQDGSRTWETSAESQQPVQPSQQSKSARADSPPPDFRDRTRIRFRPSPLLPVKPPLSSSATQPLAPQSGGSSPTGPLPLASSSGLTQHSGNAPISRGISKQSTEEDRSARLKLVSRIELCRNILIFAPVIVTWLSLNLASQAYSQSIEAHPALVGDPFLQQWTEGFPALRILHIGILRVPLSLFGWHYLNFGDAVTLTIFLLLVLCTLTWLAHHLSVQEVDEPPEWAADTLQAFDGAVKELKDILEALKKPVTEIETNISKMGSSFVEFKVIAASVDETYQRLEGAAPEIRRELQEIAKSQLNLVHEVHQSSTSMKDAASAMKDVAEPFKKEGVAEIAAEASRQMASIEALQRGVLQQQIMLYQQQTSIQDTIAKQLETLDQQIKVLAQMRPYQPQPDLNQLIHVLEQAGFLRRRSPLLSSLLQELDRLKNKVIRKP